MKCKRKHAEAMELDLNIEDPKADAVNDLMEVTIGGETKKIERPHFPAAKRSKMSVKEEMRKVPVPSNRYTPLKEHWMKIYTPLVEHLGLQVRFNTKSRNG